MKLKVTTVLAVILALFGAFFWVDTNKADAQDVLALKQDVYYLRDSIRRNDLQKRMWDLEDRYGEAAKQLPEYRELTLEKEAIDTKLKGVK